MIDQDEIVDPHSDCADPKIAEYIRHLEAEIKRLDRENKIMRSRLLEDKRWHINHLTQVLHIKRR